MRRNVSGKITLLLLTLALVIPAAAQDAPSRRPNSAQAEFVEAAFALLDDYQLDHTALDDLLVRQQNRSAFTERLELLGLEGDQIIELTAALNSLTEEVDALPALENYLGGEFFALLESSGIAVSSYDEVLLNFNDQHTLRDGLRNAGVEETAIEPFVGQIRALRQLGLDTDVVSDFITRQLLTEALQDRLSQSDVSPYVQVYIAEGRMALEELLLEGGMDEANMRDFFARFDEAQAALYASYGFKQADFDHFLLTAATFSLLKDVSAAADDPFAVQQILGDYGLDEETARDFMDALHDLPALDKLLKDYGVDFSLAQLYYYDDDKFIPAYVPPQTTVNPEATAEPTVEAVSSGGDTQAFSGPGEAASDQPPAAEPAQ